MIDVLLMFINKIKKLIGKTNDTGGSETTGTVMGKLNNLTGKSDSVYSWVNTLLSRTGSANDTGGTSTAGTIMAKLNYLITQVSNYLSNINTYATRIGTTNDSGATATSGTVMGKLNNLISGGSVIKSVQRGTFSISTATTTVTISSVNTSKCFVIIDASNTSSSQAFSGCYLSAMTSTSITISSYLERTYSGSWQVIEFN